MTHSAENDEPANGAPGANSWKGDGVRWARLTRKELREILRDRRTILTLVLMPLLLYPVLSLIGRQFLVSSRPDGGPEIYRIAVGKRIEADLLSIFLRRGEAALAASRPQPKPGGAVDSLTDLLPPLANESPGQGNSEPELKIVIVNDLEKAVVNYQAEVAVRFGPSYATGGDSNSGELHFAAELIYLDPSVAGLDALDRLERIIAAANVEIAAVRRPTMAGIPPEFILRSPPFRVTRDAIENPEKARGVSLITVAPLILILMTITGAVYPAIDLTAGERERGTLEVLVAAPVPRLSLLLAKYLAVVTVGCLTAGVNLAMMTATILIVRLGPLLFGASGLTWVEALEVAALLILFSAFFSALLLAISSFARSFKEAQAYLVPLMLAAIMPGVASIFPGLTLAGPLSIAPLINIVLLTRDLLEHNASPSLAAIVVVSTLLYAIGAVALAARFFGAESVLYTSQSGWSHLLKRESQARSAPTPSSAMMCLAALFPLQFLVGNLLTWLAAPAPDPKFAASSADNQNALVVILASGLATSLLFGLTPALAAWRGRVRFLDAFSAYTPRVTSLLGAAILGLTLWVGAHELILLQQRLGWVSISKETMRSAEEMLGVLQRAGLPATLLALAVAPAVFEELFFRGYLLGALRKGDRSRFAIFASAAIFGAFHLITPHGIAFVRWIPSTLLGLVLGWVFTRSKSVWPGIALHVLHNGLLLTLSYHRDAVQKFLVRFDFPTDAEADLPLSWLIVSAAGAIIGGLLIAWSGRDPRGADPFDDDTSSIPLTDPSQPSETS